MLIGLALLIQYFVRSNPKVPPTPHTMESFAMIVADIHIEPLHSPKNKWDACTGTPEDTPIGLFQSAIKDFTRDVPKEQRLFFFVGDTSTQGDNPTKGLLRYFNPSNIFYTVGKTQQAFWRKDTALAQSLVDNGIYKPSGPDDIFWDVGYYKKLISNTTNYVICFNSILYSGDICPKKQQQQIDQLKKDLDSLGPKNSVYILTHYPADVSTKHFIWNKIGKKYKDRVSGIFTGHSHDPLKSLDSWDTKKGKAYTWNIPSIYKAIPNKPVSCYIKVPFTLNKPLELAETDVMKTVYKDGNAVQWKN
jgi:hypothetical protein